MNKVIIDGRFVGKGFERSITCVYKGELMARVLAVDDDFLWYVKHPSAFKGYRGMHVAIWNKRVTGYWGSAKEAYEMSKKNCPESKQTMTFIPREEEIIL